LAALERIRWKKKKSGKVGNAFDPEQAPQKNESATLNILTDGQYLQEYTVGFSHTTYPSRNQRAKQASMRIGGFLGEAHDDHKRLTIRRFDRRTLDRRTSRAIPPSRCPVTGIVKRIMRSSVGHC
jgi:hypothetical protein